MLCWRFTHDWCGDQLEIASFTSWKSVITSLIISEVNDVNNTRASITIVLKLDHSSKCNLFLWKLLSEHKGRELGFLGNMLVLLLLQNFKGNVLWWNERRWKEDQKQLAANILRFQLQNINWFLDDIPESFMQLMWVVFARSWLNKINEWIHKQTSRHTNT